MKCEQCGKYCNCHEDYDAGWLMLVALLGAVVVGSLLSYGVLITLVRAVKMLLDIPN